MTDTWVLRATGFTLPLEIIVTRDKSMWTPYLDTRSTWAWNNLVMQNSQKLAVDAKLFFLRP
jgi:hypothetical protein